MGDISIIARRLEDGNVQYGWSGNGGYFEIVGLRLLLWYQNPQDVEYLFELGQTSWIGKKGSEHGGLSGYESHQLTGEAFWLGNTERKKKKYIKRQICGNGRGSFSQCSLSSSI